MGDRRRQLEPSAVAVFGQLAGDHLRGGVATGHPADVARVADEGCGDELVERAGAPATRVIVTVHGEAPTRVEGQAVDDHSLAPEQCLEAHK